MTGPMMSVVTEGVEKNFTVHRFWEIDDKDAFLAEKGAAIRGIATGGHSHVNSALIDRLPNLEIVANFGVGYDTVDAAYAGTKRIVVTNTPNVLTDEVADTAMGLTLMTVREFFGRGNAICGPGSGSRSPIR